jgi:hypothetical protein
MRKVQFLRHRQLATTHWYVNSLSRENFVNPRSLIVAFSGALYPFSLVLR